MIAGYITTGSATIDNCHVIGGSVKGGKEGIPSQQVGGIVGYEGSGSEPITNCTVTDLDVTVFVTEAEIEDDPDAYAKRLLVGGKVGSVG